MNATILPNGRVLAVGGSVNDEDAVTASRNADLYNPATNTFSSAGVNVYPRLYHSGSLLLPDATVMLVGGNPTRGSYEQHIEIYSPPYLFNANGTPATRPTVNGVTPGAFGYGQVFQVAVSDPSSIASVVLVRPGAQTHAFDMEQRLVGLSFSVGTGLLNVTAPPNGNIAPPGYYMLFILNAAGVPSVARFVQLSTSISNQRPTAIINSPATNVTVAAGGSVNFSGSGSDPDGTISAYSWTFPGGTPSSSSVASPGVVTYSTPGIYTASLNVTDNGGLTSASPATRTITVGNPPPGPAPGLVASYSFDAGSGPTLADISSNGRTGTLNGATWSTQGKYGGALAFDGSNDWVTVDDHASLDFTNALTIEAWVFPTVVGSGAWRSLLIKEAPQMEAYQLYANTDTNAPTFYVRRAAATGDPQDARAPTPMPVNTWTHLAATYDGTTLRFFVNGVQVASNAIAGPLLTSTGVLRMGGNSIWGEFFTGRIDEVRLYNRALSVAEIQADMAAPVGTDTTPPTRSNGQPSGTLPAGTTQTPLSLSTNENATCRYATSAGVVYASMTNTFTTTGGTSQSTVVSGLSNGNNYTYYVRCIDAATNANPDDFAIAFSVANPPPPDTTPPTRSNGQPSGTLPAGTTQTTLSLSTNESATCRYATSAGVAYASMANTFATTGGTAQSTAVSGLSNGNSYTYYVRCIDAATNANLDDFAIAFSVANPPPPDITPPTVSMTAPANNATVSGNVTLSATAGDNVAVVGVQFLLGSQPIGVEDTTAPYSITWNSTSVANGGPYQLSARARTRPPYQTTAAAVSVTVNNTNLGLVAAYSFNAGSGPTLADISGNGRTGTLSGATWSTQGKYGGALAFDGINDWVTVADHASLDFTNALTVEAWVFPTVVGGGAWRSLLIKEAPQKEAYQLYANTTPTHRRSTSDGPRRRGIRRKRGHPRRCQ